MYVGRGEDGKRKAVFMFKTVLPLWLTAGVVGTHFKSQQ